MKILTSGQMRAVDAYTISHEPVTSLALMERAGQACFQWIISHTDPSKKFTVVCGSGNNGGDGLVIARLLHERNYRVEVLLVSLSNSSDDFKKNLIAIQNLNIPFQEVGNTYVPLISSGGILIDAIFGTGLTRPVAGYVGEIIDAINATENEIISIDLPSGLATDSLSEGKVVQARHTLTFEVPKLAFFFSANDKYVGNFHVIDIGLDKNFIETMHSPAQYVTHNSVKQLLKARKKFSHKGDYGHGYLISGSEGKMGAAVLASRACLRAGSGLLTVRIPRCGYSILQTAVPEAMVSVDEKDSFLTKTGAFTQTMRIAVGPGIGKSTSTRKMFLDLLKNSIQPMVIDADALNLLSEDPARLKKVPPFSILTPHPKEFERLAGKTADEFERHRLQIKFSTDHKVIVVLKGAYTCISTPNGTAYFNSTGNPGMAKGGSGDVLTGILLALLCQKYEPLQAALLGVYLHGLAGDFAAKEKGLYSMLAGDIIACLPEAFNYLLSS